MIKVGITGNIACGKSLVEKFIQEEGYRCIDSDKIVHKLYQMEKTKKELIDIFSNEILTNNEIDRDKLGQIVFNNKEKRKTLEQIIHPKVKNVIKLFFHQKKEESIVFVSLPLLYEAEMQNLFDFVITVKTDLDTQIERLIKRRECDKKEALSRINSQMPQEEKVKRADFIIDNSGTIEETRERFCIVLYDLLNK